MFVIPLPVSFQAIIKIGRMNFSKGITVQTVSVRYSFAVDSFVRFISRRHHHALQRFEPVAGFFDLPFDLHQ